MAYRAEAVSFEITGGTGNKTVSLSDFGGDTPKLVMAQSTKSTSNGSYQDDLFQSFGWGDLSQEDSAQSFSEDDVGTSVVVRSIQDNLLTVVNAAGTVIDQITLVSFSADEFVINVGTYGGTPFTVLFMVLGGSTLTDVKVTSFNMVTAADIVSSITIAFVNGGGGASTITRPGGFDVFSSGQLIEVTNSALNDGFYTVVSATATVITLAAGVLTDESAGASVTIRSGFIDVTGLGFDDVDAVMMFSSQNDNGADTPPQIRVNDRESAFSFGFFDVANGSQCTESHIYSSDQETTMETFSTAGSDAECWAHFSFKSSVWALRGELTFVSVIPDGFRLQQPPGASVPTTAYRINVAALKGGNYQCVQKTAPTSPGTQAIVNSGFTPSGVIFGFGIATGSAASMCLGWASNKDGTLANTKEGVVLVSDDDNIARSNAKRLTKVDRCLVATEAGSTSPNKQASLNSWNADGCDLDFDVADGTTQIYHCIQFGDGTVTPVVTASIPIQAMVY